MGRKCAVPHCYTGYRKCKEKASLYRVPDDDFFLSKWQEAIAREDRPITPKDYVCEKHFKDDDILRRRIIKDVVEEYQRPRLKPDSIPSVFPDLPEFVLKMVKKRRKMPVENKEAGEYKSETDEQTISETQVKEEPIENESECILPETMCETIVQNFIDIKSEVDENSDNSADAEGDDERQGPNSLPKMHRCDQCEYQTKYPHNLRTHKTKHLSGKDAYLYCEHCPNYKTKWDLTFRNHQKIKHGIGKQEIFRCTLCPFETRVKLCLKRHCDRHKREEKALDECKSVDIDRISDNHAEIGNVAAEVKSFKCTECDYGTNSKTHIISHIKSVHNTGDDTNVTVNNSKITKAPSTLLENIELGKSLYKCLKCPYRSKSHGILLKHVFKHKYSEPIQNEQLKAKIWKCPKCPYATFFQHALQRHQQTECGKEVFSCSECSFSANLKADYIKHMLTHRNVSVELLTQVNVNGEVEKVCVQPDTQNVNSRQVSEEIVSESAANVNESADKDINKPLEFVAVDVKEELHFE